MFQIKSTNPNDPDANPAIFNALVDADCAIEGAGVGLLAGEPKLWKTSC